MASDSLFDICEARFFDDRDKLHEASLSRVLTHAENLSKQSFAMMTAYRGDFVKPKNPKEWTQAERDENKRLCKLANEELETDLAGLTPYGGGKRVGYFPVIGKWWETVKGSEEKREVNEMSFAIQWIRLKDLISLIGKYRQDAGIYAGPEMVPNDHGFLVKGDSAIDIGKLTVKSVTDTYRDPHSQLSTGGEAGRSFIFEWVEQHYGEERVRFYVERSCEKNGRNNRPRLVEPG